MKFCTNSSFLTIGISIWICTVETAISVPRSYIVEYVEEGQHDIVSKDLQRYQKLYNVHHTYSSDIFHGMSFSLKDEDAKPQSLRPVSYSADHDKIHSVYNQLEHHPAIKRIYPIQEVPRPQWMTSTNSDNYSFPYADKDSQISDIHHKLSITGKDVLIGILDSGIDYNHPALGGGFGEGFKVRFGHNLVSKSRDEDSGVEPLGDDDPYDPCVGNDAGHGTHVAGVIAGYDKEKNFTGIAPNATLGMWRIFGCQGGAGEDTVIKAMEMAFKAGCKVINLSLGIENNWPEDAMSAVADNLTKKGVIVVGVAGNQGSVGAYAQNAPGSGKNVLSVASVDNSFYPADVLRLDILPEQYFPYVFSSNTISFPNGSLAHIMNNGSIPFGCKDDTSIDSENAKGKIVLLRRGICTFAEKLKQADKAGAIGVLFYDPDPNAISVTVAKNDNGTLPLAGIEYKLATQIIDYFEQKNNKDKPIQLHFPSEKKLIAPVTAGKISDFSSTGPNYELDLKPSITGIGGNVYSTVPTEINGGWIVKSGTSMAAPQVAGSVALLIEYYSKHNKNVTAEFITEKLQNHAKIVTAKSGSPENPVVQGAGLIQPLSTIESGIHISPSHISFNDTASLKDYKSHTLNIHNSNNFSLFISLENKVSDSVQPYANETSFTFTEPVIRNGTVKVDLEFTPAQHSVVLPPLSTTAVQVKVVLPDPNDLKYHYQIYGGYISLMSFETGESLATVPYFGVLGKMIELPVFDKGFPYLAPNSKNENRVKEDKVYNYDLTRKSETKPAIAMRLLTGSANIEIKVYDSNQTYIGGMAGGPWIYNSRNTAGEENYFSSITWSGKIIPSKDEQAIISYDNPDKAEVVQDGTYYLGLRALKHFGDPGNDTDWEEWQSGPIKVTS